MADLLVNIKADNKNFDRTITESTNQIRKFESQSKSAGKGINDFEGKVSGIATGALTKMAGALGVAFGAMETFNGIIKSTQATSDNFDIKMQQVRSSVDYFFTSIANGDWSNFWEGLDGAIQRGKELAETLDYLGDVQAGYSVKEFDLKNNIQDSINVLYDPDSTEEQIEKAKKDIGKNFDELSRITTERVIPAFQDAVRDSFKDASQMSDITDEDIAFYYTISLKDDEGYKEYIKNRKELENLSKETEQVNLPSGGTTRSRTARSYEAEKQFELYKRQNEYLEKMYRIENNITDTERGKISSLIIQGKQIERNNLLLEKQINRAEARGGKSSGGTTTIKPEIEPLQEGSIAAIDKQISDLNKKISLSIDPEEQRLLYQQIEELKNQKIVIEVQYKYSKPEDIGVNTDFSVEPRINTEKIEGDIAGMGDWFNTYQSNLKKMEEDSVSSADNIGLAFSSIGNIFGVLGGITDDTTSRMLGGFQTVLGGIGTLIPAIQALTVAEQTEAIAGATASGAKQPFPLNLVAIASGIAAVIAGFAQMSKIPKFADGGLVYGNTIAQVGEYPGASNNPEVIAPLSKLKNLLTNSGSGSGTVDFRISGKDLVGTIENYSSIKRKK